MSNGGRLTTFIFNFVISNKTNPDRLSPIRTIATTEQKQQELIGYYPLAILTCREGLSLDENDCTLSS